ncbi:membrane protein [Gordonia phage Hitter]|nr:membrane protein [Gordonia phage Hitter]
MFLEFVLRNLGFCTITAFAIGAGVIVLIDLARGAFERDVDAHAMTIHNGEIVEADQ